jgi:hypothetical protein
MNDHAIKSLAKTTADLTDLVEWRGLIEINPRRARELYAEQLVNFGKAVRLQVEADRK